jgi:hypothetical protein
MLPEADGRVASTKHVGFGVIFSVVALILAFGAGWAV